jgi:tRNA dimethylallyltransferase
MQKKLIVIVGPTASGKTALSIELAKRLDTEIISADSRQFYKEMNIGTAKPSVEELKTIKHHFINNLGIQDYFSAGDFERAAMQCLDNLFQTHAHVLLCGGSGLYIQALCEGMTEMPAADLKLREQLEQDYQNLGIEFLQKKLTDLNPEKLKQIDLLNPQRLMRAIEMETQKIDLTNPKLTRPFEILKFGIEMDRTLLYKRINERVDQMISAGLLEEARDLFPQRQLNALQTVGYKELFDFFSNECNLAFAIDKIKQHSRNYAKRQMTWFKRDQQIQWIEAKNNTEMADEIMNTIENQKID